MTPAPSQAGGEANYHRLGGIEIAVIGTNDFSNFRSILLVVSTERSEL